MLEELNKPITKTEENFRDSLIRMLITQRVAQVLIKAFQETEMVRDNVAMKPLKRFSQEVFVKTNWFYTTVKKIAGPNAEFLDAELDLEGDKVNNIGSAIDAIALSDKNMDNETNLLTSSTYRKDTFRKCWFSARGLTYAPELVDDIAQFEDWYSQQFQ